LNPAFNNTSIRGLTPIFFDSAYKVQDYFPVFPELAQGIRAHQAKVAWEALIDLSQSGETLIDVQCWMKHVS
jgi:hypothetical protein